ncbi:MAG: valine--tRNA ligase [Candidatus Omnitrophota bacterium]
MKEIPTKYNPREIEEHIYAAWEDSGFFHADENTRRDVYSIVIPPPNVTGILHMGHALNNTIQDILIRWKRMQGFETLWMPGTDHAGIATQNVVERKLSKEGVRRHDLGREKFLEKVWEWKEASGNTIIHQLKRLGCSCDWGRVRFTMDEGLSKAVKEVFVRLYRDGLLYKGDYIINWCPRCTTALSDEEAEHRDVDGMLYYIKYPVKGSAKAETLYEDYVIVATTRPETMLGDVAVAVNPGDQRYSGLRGKSLILPILKRELKLVFDENVDPDFGTGALKVTPAHDPVDFELGIRHGLQNINVMNPDATINELGGDYEGMDRFECREAIIEDLKQRNLFVRSEEHKHAVGHCYRCHTVVEPRLSKQWFVRMKPLAEEAEKVVREGQIRFFPERWTKVYLNWMENIRDWCVSRQIWWGHRIPVWYCGNCVKSDNVREVNVEGPERKGVYVGSEPPEKCPDCGGTVFEQDPDVLDTWFSSWLWPFSTMGWPENTKTLNTFYPTETLVTAQEIIFFWVARMIMAGLKFRHKIPFRDVYIHGTVRDSTGTKMSKSLGNVIDPLNVIEEVGSDALRFSIISITSQGQDVFLSKEKFEIGRNFANKLWNAARYVQMNLGDGFSGEEPDAGRLTLADKWILSSFNVAAQDVSKNLNSYRFNDAAAVLYDFIWHKYCDWYLEISKLSSDKENVQKVLLKVLKGCLSLLHPFMPFITEEIWGKIPCNNDRMLIVSPWPVPEKEYEYNEAVLEMEMLIGSISAIRNIRSFWNVDNKATVEAVFSVSTPEEKKLILENSFYIEKMARCNIVSAEPDAVRPEKSVASLAGGMRIYVPLGDTVDIDNEKRKITDKAAGLENYLKSIDKKLLNKSFLDNAPEDVVQKEQAKREKFSAQLANLRDNLNALD